MKKLILILLFTSSLFAQSPFSALIPEGRYTMSITPSDRIWMAGISGEVFYSDAPYTLWHRLPIINPDDEGFSKGTFENISFFNDEIGFISGFIFGENGNEDFIFRTEDAGKSWQKVYFGRNSWINDLSITTDGKAWMTGSSGLIYYSDDFGKTWNEFSNPDEESERLSAIYFNKDGMHGLAGALDHNKLYYTQDNCKTWKQLPTPFTQKKYSSYRINDRHTIEKIRTFGNGKFYILEQQGRIFYSASQNIDWKELPEVTNYEVTDQEGIALKYKDGTFECFNKDFESTWKNSEEKIPYMRNIIFSKNTIYGKTQDEIYKINKDNTIHNELLTDDIGIEKPYVKINFKGKEYGNYYHYIISYDSVKEKWYRFLKTPFYINGLTINNNKLLVSCFRLHKNVYADIDSKEITPYIAPENIISPSASVISIEFESGSRGCFHNGKTSVIYNHESELYIRKSENKNLKLPETINKTEIEELVKQINSSQHREILINDFGFTEKDIQEFIKFINKSEREIKKGKYQYDNYKPMKFDAGFSDFEYYRKKALLINSVSEEIIKKAFTEPESISSTTVDWNKITLKLSNGSTIILTNDDYAPKYLSTPWEINVDGALLSVNSVKIGNIINQITKGKFLSKEQTSKTYALFTIIDYMYRESLEKEILK
ncbi:WD40/YVTN/BNR-like repeat-containing protein [Flavobacterium sp. RHBU_3]|uniref:WD40/YVTN/BNR-like repeat-containing protein n=1 Tax=Flavobacterium sp. RHBU_3 TaxID=3391184 RepID=UPI003984B719